MPAFECERCGARPAANSYEMFDYCALCSKNLCPKCFTEGCCKNVPAISGAKEDAEPDEEPGSHAYPYDLTTTEICDDDE